MHMHILFENLPAKLQEEIIFYLQSDNFTTAKRIRDEYERKYLQDVENLSESNTPTVIPKESHSVDA